MKILKLTFLSICVLVVTIFSINGVAFFYNHHLHPLSKLAKGVELGDSFDVVKNKFDSYKGERNDNSEFQYVINYPKAECDFMLQKRQNVKGCFFIYDQSVFDNVRFTVVFDNFDKVMDRQYIGD